MGGSAIILQIILALVFIFFCVLTYYVAKGWNALHVVMTFLTFVMAFVLLAMTSMSLKTHTKFRQLVSRYERELTDARNQGELMMYGDRLKVVQDEPTVLQLSSEFNRIMYERGRVWRGCQTVNFQNNAVELMIVPEGTPAGVVHGIGDNMILYAFLEMPYDLNGDGQPDSQVPGAYMGEFKVTAKTDTTVTIAPNLPLDPLRQQLSGQPTTWTLYEMMPLDGHHVFAESNAEYVEPDDTESQAIFGPMNETQLRNIFGMTIAANFPNMPPDQQERYLERVVGPYLRDGQPLSLDQAAQIPEENLWYKVKFTRRHSVDVDAKPSLSGSSTFFDPDGLSIVPRLMRGEAVQFRENEIGIFKKGSEDLDEGGNELRDNDLDDWLETGIVEMITPIFVRELNAYPEEFQLIYMRQEKVLEDSRLVQRNIELLQAAKEDCDQQIVFRREERAKLSGEGLPEGQMGELPGFQMEVAALDKLLGELTQQKSDLLEELSLLYRTNLALEQQLGEIQAQLTEEINRRTTEAATASIQ